MRVLALAVIVSVPVLAACAISHHPPHPLSGTDWSLLTVGSAPAWAGAKIAFPDGSRFYGYGGCNSFDGRYEAEADPLTVTSLTTTERGCATPALSRREREMVAVLVSAQRFRMDGEWLLVIEGADGVLVFER